MGAAFFITLREGLEAALIVAIVMAYLRQLDRTKEFSWVLLGALPELPSRLLRGLVSTSPLANWKVEQKSSQKASSRWLRPGF